jgi:glycosyltransferase involved in cell wall biosynthesis
MYFNVNFTTAIYKTQLLNQHRLRFTPKAIYGEDRPFPLKAAFFASRLEVISDVYYYYERREDSGDSNFLKPKQAQSYIEEIKSIINFVNIHDIDNNDYAYVTVTFLLELIRIFRISANQTRKTILNCLIDLFMKIPIKYGDCFGDKFSQEEPAIYAYLKKEDFQGLFDYLLDQQTEYLNYLFVQTERIKQLENILVSVIIPVYDVELYLGKCLESILGQTHKNLEIICVNDCSLDNSVRILSEFQEKDKRIKIISHDKNKGQGTARNTGLDKAKGEYVYFFDSDDWIDSDYIELMLCSGVSHEAEIVLNTNIIASDTHTQFLPRLVPNVTDTFLPAKTNIHKIIWNVWAHLYKRSFLIKNNIKFFEEKDTQIMEDVCFQYIAYAFVEKVYIIKKSCYHYTVRQGNSTHKYIANGYKHIRQSLIVVNKIYDFYVTKGLFNKYDIKMFWENLIPPFGMPQKEELCSLLRDYFVKIKEQVFDRWYLYSKFELSAFYAILDSRRYIQKADLRKMVSSKRNNLIKGGSL